jgi:hypothetical protein
VPEYVRSLRLDRHRSATHMRALAQAATGTNVRVSTGRGRFIRVIIRERVDASGSQRRVCKLWIKVGDRFIGIDHGLERWCDLLLRKQVPIDRLEERMLFQLLRVTLRTQAVLRVTV